MAATTIQTTSARPHRTVSLSLEKVVVDGDSKIAELGGNATSPDNLAELGYELAELGSSGLYQWNYDNFASDCYTLISGNRWSTAHVRNGDACYRTCGSLGRVLGGYDRFCKDARAERTYTNLPPHQKVKVEFKVVSIDGKEWSNKKFKLQHDSTTHWFGNVDKRQGGRGHVCGGSSNHENDRDGVHTYSREFSHSSDSLKLLISTSLSTPHCHESSWALSYVKIYLNNMPPPPSPPPPSPPPPPPGRRDEPTVEILNAQKVVSNREFDFGISVSHPTCANSKSCFESEDDIKSNQKKGLRCDVRVQAKEQTSCSKYGEYLPCMQWNSFYDSKKTAQTRKTLRVTKKDGQIQSGDIEIRYRKATGTDTGEQILHTFKVAEGCSEWLASSRIHIGDLFLQSSPEFLNADCDRIHLVKESLFRKFDVNPLDGVLSLDEVRAAFSAHDVDTGYLEHVAKTTTDFSDQGGILLSKIIQSAQLPTRCFSIDSEANAAKSSPIYIRSATYPTSRAGEETTAAQCEAQKGLVSVSWDYSKVPGDSDYQCAYADGRLYEKFNGAAVRTLTDIRPAVGTGDSKVTLVAQLTFDDNDLPFMSTQGNNGYDGNKWKKGFSIEACGDGINAQPILPQSSAHAIPVIGNNVTRVRFDKSVSGDALSFASLISRVAFNPISVNAVEQMSDLVHQYDKKKSKNQAGNDEEPASLGRKSKSISRLGSGSEEENSQSSDEVSCTNNGASQKDFSDDSAVKVNGIVMFEPWKTQGYACGLPFAKIQAYSYDESEQVYVHEGTYFSDTSGRFEIGVPIGEGRTFVVHGGDQDVLGHTICYVGNSVDIEESDEKCVSRDSVEFPAPGEGSSIFSSSYYEVAAAVGGENLVFLDTSTRSVDIGLYAGSCDSQYEGYELLITPANGCGAAAVVTYDDIQAWQCVDGSVGPCNGNERTWPYAAMDYYIQIEMAPDVSRMDVEFIRATTVGAGATCEAGTEIMQYFRNRDMLVQTVLLLDLESATVATNRYEYHSYLCSVITREDGGGGEGDTNAPTTIFHALSSSSEACLNTDPDEGDLTSNYLIGTTMRDNGRTIDASKRVGVKVFEAHYTSTGDTFTTCSDFQSSTTNIVVQIKDGITGGDNTCHPSKAPSEECKFSSVLATGDENVGFVDFGNSQYYREISSGSAIPNLVTPYRRSFSAHIERNDGWAITSMTVERELVVLTSKTRGEGGKPEDRYVSNSEFYATAPVQGLVYTVVHDPPGGNSFSSISKGTKIDLEMGLATTRAAEKTSEWGFAAGLSVEGKISNEISAGSGYLNLGVMAEHNGARFESGVHGGYAQEGPTVTISGETDNGWDFHMTLDRNLESSQDPAIPGRPGDVILGGGFEIVYVRSDKVDFQSDTSHCLGVVPIIEWKGRKPTTVYGAYTQNDDLSPDYTAKKDWEELSEVWDSIPSDNAPLHGVPKIRRTDAWKNDGGQEANGKAAAIGPLKMLQAGNVALLPLTPLAAVMGTVIDRMVNPNPEAYLDDKVKIIVEGTGEESHDPNGRWFPTKSDKWLSSYEPGGTGDDGRNLFNSNEDDPDKDEGLWSRGMSNYAKTKEMKATFPDSIENMDSSMVDASLFGGQAQFGFTGYTKSTPTISDQEKQDVYLSFSGGGHNLEFSSSIESNIDSYGYSWSMEAEGSVSASTDFNMAVGVWELEAELADTYGKSIGQEKVLAWAKYGEMEVTYTLGDDDPYDKFVIQVSNDKRFGTPLFRTIGGSSKCPGEPNTMWRESGLGIEAKHAAGSNNKFVLHGKPALFDVIITNDSPYREGHIYGLLLTSNETNGGSSFSGGNMLDLKFSINVDNTKLRPFGDLLPLHDVPSTDDTGNSINTKLTLSVEKGNLSNEYAGIFLKLVSECEWQMSRDLLYRDPISDAYSLDDIKWQRECPEIAWDETTVNKYLYYIASVATSDVLDVSVMNPNPLNIWTSDKYEASDTVRGGWDVNKDHLVHPNVEFVRVQFRRPGIGEWISAWDDSKASADVTCGHSTSGCGLSWNLTKQYFMNGLRDGSWEIRAKIFCSGGAITAPMSVFGSTTKENLNLVVDVTSPKPIALSVMDKLFVVEYTEPVICPQLKTDEEIYQVTRIEDCDGNTTKEVIDWTTILLQYSFRCIEDKINAWTMQLPSDLDNQGKYQIVVGKNSTSGLTDVGGNVVAKMTFDVDFCSASATVAVVSSSLNSANAVAAKSAAAVGNSKRSRRNKTDTQNERVKGKNAASSELGVVKDEIATSNLFTFAPSTLLAGILATTVVSATIAFTIARRISHPIVTSIDGDSPYEDKKPLLESTIPEQPAYGSVI
ncbi:unnamed protein product [Bathycoccus prasinos]